MSSLLLAVTSSLKRVGDCLEQQEITIFYSDAGLPTLSSDNRIISCNVTLINTFHHSLDTILSNNPLSFLSGHWFSRHWVDTRTEEWFTPAVKAAFQATLTATQVIQKLLSECLLEDWRSSWTQPPSGDPHCHFTPLGEPPDTLFHPFVQGSSPPSPACTNLPPSKSLPATLLMPPTHPAFKQMPATTPHAHIVANATQSTTFFLTAIIFGTSAQPSSSATKITFFQHSPVARCWSASSTKC
jgi:hypothetical protein